MILSVRHISKSFLDVSVIQDATFHLEETDKVALIGNNGTGKTTLFNCIAGELPYDCGEITFKKNSTLGYLHQINETDSLKTVFEEVLSVKADIFELENRMHELEAKMSSANENDFTSLFKEHEKLLQKYDSENGYAVTSEITGVLKGVGFTADEFTLPVSSLSGGEKTRVFLAKLLISKPDLLLLDEPTNHLDIHATEWLETYLKNYPKAVLIISHDRYFLNRIADKVILLENKVTEMYEGNYDDFYRKHTANFNARMKAYENQQKEIAHQEQVIATLRSYKQEIFYKRAESREKLLQKMDVLEKPTEENNEFRLHFSPKRMTGKDVLRVSNLSMSYENHPLFSDFSFELFRGERVFLLGDNGTGKSTLLKILLGLVKPTCGEFSWGDNVDISYYDQEHHELSPEKTLFEEIQDEHPAMTNTEVRNLLASFRFTGDDVFKKIRDLSGGERGRILLAKLMLSTGNVLILDEPTNHLDLLGKEILENALKEFEGTVFIVSHDRYFVKEVATRILEIKDSRLFDYPGGYEYFKEKQELFHARISSPTREKNQAKEQIKENYREKREREASTKKQKKELEKTEKEIALTEAEIRQLEAEMEKPENSTNASKLSEITAEINVKNEVLLSLYELWEELSSEGCEKT